MSSFFKCRMPKIIRNRLIFQGAIKKIKVARFMDRGVIPRVILFLHIYSSIASSNNKEYITPVFKH